MFQKDKAIDIAAPAAARAMTAAAHAAVRARSTCCLVHYR